MRPAPLPSRSMWMAVTLRNSAVAAVFAFIVNAQVALVLPAHGPPTQLRNALLGSGTPRMTTWVPVSIGSLQVPAPVAQLSGGASSVTLPEPVLPVGTVPVTLSRYCLSVKVADTEIGDTLPFIDTLHV